MSVTATPATTLLSDLAAIGGPGNIITDPPSLAAFTVDEIVPRAVVSPDSPEQVAAVLKLAHARNWVVVPAGGFTHQSTGAVPEQIDIVLRTNRLTAVEHYNAGDLMIGVGAGATLTDVERVVQAHGQMLPLDGMDPEKCTIGGAIATAAQGTLKHAYGGLRDFCTGVRFVTADGKIAKAGARVVKNVAGYDLMKLLIGSYGTIAVITSASFKLFPAPRQTRTFVAQYPTLAAALEFRDMVMRSPLTPLALEIVSPHVHAALAGAAQVNGDWRVLLRAAGSDKVLARYRAELAGASTREIAGDDERAMWRFYAQLPDLLTASSQNAMLLRLDAAPQDLGKALESAERAAVDNNFVTAAYGRVGVGALTVGFLPIAVDPPSAMQYVNAISYLRGELPRDASAIVVRCPLEAKRHFNVWGSSPNDMEAMRAIKRAFDEKDILNRGRFLF